MFPSIFHVYARVRGGAAHGEQMPNCSNDETHALSKSPAKTRCSKGDSDTVMTPRTLRSTLPSGPPCAGEARSARRRDAPNHCFSENKTIGNNSSTRDLHGCIGRGVLRRCGRRGHVATWHMHVVGGMPVDAGVFWTCRYRVVSSFGLGFWDAIMMSAHAFAHRHMQRWSARSHSGRGSRCWRSTSRSTSTTSQVYPMLAFLFVMMMLKLHCSQAPAGEPHAPGTREASLVPQDESSRQG